MLDKADLVEALPKQMRRNFNDATYMNLATALKDPDELARFKDNFITYTGVLKDGKYSVQQYIDAVKYVSYKNMGMTNKDAFARTFPMKMKRYRAEGQSDGNVNAHVSGYNKCKIVTKIFEQGMIPIHVLNQDAVQEAINALLGTLRTSKNDLAVVKAADSLLTHLKPPVETKIQLDIGMTDTPMLQEIKEESMKLALQHHEFIKSGQYTATQIAEMKVVGEGEYVELSGT